MGCKIRNITFPVIKNSDGVRRNHETGVEIVAQQFLDGPVTGYEIRIPALNPYGYTVAAPHVRTLAEARKLATEQAEIIRNAIAEAYDAAAEVLEAEIRETYEEVLAAENAALHQTLQAAVRSVQAGYPGAAAIRLNRVRNHLRGVETMPSDEQAAAELNTARETLPFGTPVTDTVTGVQVRVIDRPIINAENNKVSVGVCYANGARGNRYVTDLRLS